ncbi:MAG TPA: N,N-dimethylformamidase beta subunit family domain-containing protein [Cyclobacteriaceae bacterium]|nr:N,N-dimethylformamidase beta subunit family domain-containing protein [Cyclobacteriaceae bacterium]
MKIPSLIYLSFFLLACAGHEEKEVSANLITMENQKDGADDWIIEVPHKACDPPEHQFCRRPEIEGYCSRTSIPAGDTLNVFVSTNPVSEYTLNIYRMGYYGGKGARLVYTSEVLPGIIQKDPDPDPKTNFFECNWEISKQIVIPEDWLSGVYLGKLTALKDTSESYIIFIVKDNRKVDFIFQCSDLTWQAYNRWPYWHSMYDEGHNPWINTNGARISFDRPYALYVNGLPSDFNPLSNGSGEFLLWEHSLAFWMEKEGYDVTYISNTDTHSNPQTLLRAKTFLSVGHDEYWTKKMFENVTAARDSGINLLFLSGNSVDGVVYLDPSTDGRPDRVTGRLPERSFFNEQELMGSESYGVGYCDFVCKAPDHWLFEGTGMKLNDRIPDLIGWEYHGRPAGSQPGLTILAENEISPNVFADENAPNHIATIYSTPKGNIVFNAGTCWWSLALSTPAGFQNPVCNQGDNGYRVMDFEKDDERVIIMTKNLFARCQE